MGVRERIMALRLLEMEKENPLLLQEIGVTVALERKVQEDLQGNDNRVADKGDRV